MSFDDSSAPQSAGLESAADSSASEPTTASVNPLQPERASSAKKSHLSIWNDQGQLSELAVGRLLHLAIAERPTDGRFPPIRTCVETATPIGSIFSATREFRQWFDLAYPPTPGDHRLSGALPVPAPRSLGETTEGKKEGGAVKPIRF